MPRPWIPRRVLATPSALALPFGTAMVERAAALGSQIVRLNADRLTGLPDAYRDAKTTMAIVTASPSRRCLQPIPPSADWRFDLAEGCPAHCTYCYLAGSLAGPPIIRAYANLGEILAELPGAVSRGQVTSATAERAHEGTTFECSCYTDPLAIEHLTGSLAACITAFGAWDAPVQLRFTTKFDAVAPLLGLAHNRRTRIRFSVNAAAAERHEGGAPRMPARLAALRAVAEAGYPVGLTVAPILRVPDWAEAYDRLFRQIAGAVADVPGLDLTAELITHRFTPKSKDVLTRWYPGSPLEMDEARRSRKVTKFGSVKWVFPKTQMAEMRSTLETALAREDIPAAGLVQPKGQSDRPSISEGAGFLRQRGSAMARSAGRKAQDPRVLALRGPGSSPDVVRVLAPLGDARDHAAGDASMMIAAASPAPNERQANRSRHRLHPPNFDWPSGRVRSVADGAQAMARNR